MSDWKERGIVHHKIELFMQSGQYKNALKLALKLLKKDPKDLDVLYNIGIIYAHLGNISKAKEMNERILALNPTDADALINMAQFCELKGSKGQAKEYYSKALDSNFLRMFRVKKLWDLALERYKEDKDTLKKIADQCIYQGNSEKLMDLEMHTHILGPDNFTVATKLCSVLNKFQMIFSSPPVLAPFPEMFFAINEVWDQFLKHTNLEMSCSLFIPGVNIEFESINMDTLDKINSFKLEKLVVDIIRSLEALQKEGKYETTVQLMAKRDQFEVRRTG